MTTFIKDIFDLPDRVRRGDFVLRLTEGVIKPKETVENYVVTKQLANSFDEALSLIRSSISARSSKAAYLHGSFGSGKSHFMAVLSLLLQNNPHARSIPELAPIVAKHNEWTVGKKFLLVPYHMIGATDMESAILGGYAEHIKRIHPEAATPGVFRADEIFLDAQNLRSKMGDDAFFAELNKNAKSTNGGWGDIGAGWNSESFEVAMDAAPKSEDRVRLVGDLVERFFTAVRGAGEFVDLDTGLAIISKHTQSLGYDALILFLDELILWLASHAADINFISQQGSKLAKLVEAQKADRPVPIISFVARQRDLKELVGENITGAEKLSFSDTLRWWEDRFSKITLEDRNLPAIAEKRVLKPKSEAARQMLDEEFKKTASIREEVMKVLLTNHADRAMFRQLYPFSPALVETLVAVSFLLQRERTALKVMLQLLVEQKDRLKLGEIIPVGDLFDAIAEGDEAFNDLMKVHFENAKKLYYQKLRPILEHDYGLRFEDAANLPFDDTKATALRNDDRLIKTLLLSALAPNVESLRGLTASRLAALNHGTIKTPIAGSEIQIVTNKCKKWAADCGSIKIGDEVGGNPTISITLTGIDTEAIIEKASKEDNNGNRIRKIRELLFDQLGVKQEDQLFLRHDFMWRTTKRSCEIIFSNIRDEQDLPDNSLTNPSEDWRVIIDYPFDAEGRGPRDDVARLEKYQSRYEQPTRTIAWIPSFLSIQALKELGTLIVLDYILAGDRFYSYADYLSPIEQNAAKSLLDNQRSQLRQRMINYLEGAYGIAKPASGSINQSNELTTTKEHFQTLDSSLTLQPPAAANLREAFVSLLDQALKYQYPAHPLFESDAKLNSPALRRAYETIERAAQEEGERLFVEPDKRKELKQIINPLKLGEVHETVLLLSQHWKTHFLKKEAAHKSALTVAIMRTWIDIPEQMGLPQELQNLVIMSFAAQTNRSFFLHGSPASASIDNLNDDMELREQALPSQTDWDKAISRGTSIFKITSSPLLNAANAAKFVSDIKTKATEIKPTCDELFKELRNLSTTLGVDKDIARLQTTQATKNLVDELVRAEADEIVKILVNAKIVSSETAMETSIRKAEAVIRALKNTKWKLIEHAANLSDERATAGQQIWQSLLESVRQDEYAVALEHDLTNYEDRAASLLADIPKTKPTPSPQAGSASFETAPKRSAHKVISHGEKQELTIDELDKLQAEIKRQLADNSKARLRIAWEVYEK